MRLVRDIPRAGRAIAWRWLDAAAYGSAHAIHRARRPSDYRAIDPIAEAYSAASGIAHRHYRYSLVSLARIVEEARPRNILELGSGGTTAILARYAAESGARLTSVDESEEWLDVTRSLIQVGGDIELVHAPRIVDREGDTVTGIRYDFTPSADHDLVLVDGPSLIVDGNHHHTVPVTDVLGLLSHSRPSTIIVDKRRPTVDALARIAEPDYSLLVSDVIRGRPLPGYRYFSVFSRRDA